MTCTAFSSYIPANRTGMLAVCALLALLLGMMCGEAGAVEYSTSSGINDINSGNCSLWSTLLSNNDSTVTCNINVNSGALNLSNATIRMGSGYSINVENGATLNVTDSSTITHSSGNYYFNYKSGSYGNLSESIIEYSYKLQIATKNNMTITDCTIRNNQNYGIYLTSTSGYVNITGCAINDTVDYNSIFIDSSMNNTLRNNNLNNNNGNYNLYITGNYDQDIDTTNKVNDGTVHYRYNESGTITDTDIGHVTIVDCSNLSFTNCIIHNGDGVRIRGASSNVSIIGGTIEKNTMYGISFESASWNNITSVTIKKNTNQGVYFDSSSNNLINDCHILDNNKDGIYTIETSSNNRIINNSIINNSVGIYLAGNGNNNIKDNNVSGNRGDGIRMGSATEHNGDNTIRNNTILSNSGAGVLFYSKNNDLSENSISDNYPALQFIDPYYNNSIWRNNTANGEEVNYYYNEHDITVESKYLSAYNVSNVGKITLIGCTNITIRDSELSNNSESSGYGIFLWNSNNNDLTNNTISNNRNGIRLYGSSSNNITDLDTISPSEHCGAQFESNSDYNHIIDSNLAATTSNGMSIASDHTTIIDTTISSVNADGVSVSGSHTSLINVKITSTDAKGLYTNGDYTTVTESNITAYTIGVRSSGANHTDILNTTITAGTDGINMFQSHWGNLINNIINATEKGIFLTTSRDYNLTANHIMNYTSIGILLEEYSTNTTMIGNNLTPNGTEFDIRINDSNGANIANNESTATNYTFYLTGNTRLCTLDTVFNKTRTCFKDTASLTVMWRIDVLCRDNYHLEHIWANNLTVRYGDLSDAGNVMIWDGEIPLSKHGRLSGNAFDDYGPPNSSSNWLPIIEYKQNVSVKTTYQPMNCTAVNWWDKQANKTKTYRNVTTRVTGPGLTILVDTGYTPNGKCYYCHVDKLKFIYTAHWMNYSSLVFTGNPKDPYTPGQCVDCHNENDSISIPHGDGSGKDLLYQQSPMLCYNGKGGSDCHSSNASQARLKQEVEFGQTTHHPLGDGKLACKACHDNHGTDEPYDLLKYYTNSTSGGYNSANFALCFVCHLEEKIVAKMDDTDSHLQNYRNLTNFRDEYYGSWSGGFVAGLRNIHSPQSGQDGYQHTYTCYNCHNPHGSDNPATTRFIAKDSGTFNYTYITNVSPPDNTAWKVLDYANWNNSTMNKGGGLYNPSCVCHSPTFLSLQASTPSFIYRTYVNYTPAGGPDCVGCHDNGDPNAIRPIVNVTAMKLAMHQNLSRMFRDGGILQGNGSNWAEWAVARGYNASISRDNAICWACHSTDGKPPFPGYHPDRTMNPYKCPKCHGPYDGQPPHTQGLVAAIDNHGPTTKGAASILIQTDVGKNGSCGDCHAPSKLPENRINPGNNLKVWKYGTGSTVSVGWTPYTGRTTMGNVSHYGLNRSQGIAFNIENRLVNSSDCLFCHCNSTNGAIWGNAPNVSGNMYNADTSNLSECYSYCHVRSGWVGSVTQNNLEHFHNQSIYAGGGPNCVLCHDMDSEYGVQSLVNSTAISQGIHKNLLNATLIQEGFGMDNRSKPCWGCHQSDGTIPEGMGDRNGITDADDSGTIEQYEMPYTCEDCHARSDVWNSATDSGETWLSASDPDLGQNVLPPIVYAHYPNSLTLKTNVKGEGRCVDCHNNSVNPDHGDTVAKVIGNTIFANVSHYGTKTELITQTGDCGICHNSTSATKWGDPPQNGHGNCTNYSTGDGCYTCHTTDGQTPVDFHADKLWSGKGGSDCLTCHSSTGFAIRKRINVSVFGEAVHKNMNSTSLPGLNKSCWACHFDNGLNASVMSTVECRKVY